MAPGFSVFILLTTIYGESLSLDADSKLNAEVTLKTVMEKLAEMNEVVKRQESRIEKQDELIRSLARDIKRQEIKDKEHDKFIESLQTVTYPIEDQSKDTSGSLPSLYVQTEYVCDAGVLSITCPTNKTISIESAYYGQYVRTCSVECCPPYPEDCTELMEDHAPGDWYILTTSCDTYNSCEVENPGTDVHSCESPYDSDYALVYYTCLPEDGEQASAFSATVYGSVAYATGDVIIFDEVITNIGNNYNAAMSTYLCPRAGLYMFSVSVINYSGSVMHVNIMIENSSLATAYCDGYVLNESNHASVTVVVECARSQRVWVKSMSSSNYMWAGYKTNVFSGFLLTDA